MTISMPIFRGVHRVRVLFAALALASVAACASTPAPVRSGHYPVPPPSSGSLIPPGSYTAPRILSGMPPMQCVPFARSASGVELYGDANTWWVQAEGRYARSGTPAPGSVLVLRGYNDANRGHVAVVSAMISAREILVDHANWLNQGEVSLSVPVMDVSPDNDWSAVRVWHIPSNDWGARVYTAEGFIHAFQFSAGL